MTKKNAAPGGGVRHQQAVDGARWQAVLKSARDAIISIDTNARITLFNPAAEEMFGYTSDEVSGANVAILMPEPYRSEHDRYIEKYQQTGEARAIGRIRHVEGRRKNGQRFPIELSVSATPVNGATLYTAIIRDVSAQEALKQELQRERDFARALVDTAQTILLLVAKDGRIAMYNPYLARLSGYELRAVMGMDWFETFVVPSERLRARESFSRTLAGQPAAGAVIPIVIENGEQRDIEWHGDNLLDDTGGITGVLYSGIDITQHLRTQDAIRTREAQQTAVATLGRLGLASSNIAQLTEEAAELVRQTLDTDFAKILEFVPEHRILRVVAGEGWPQSIVGRTTKIDDEISHSVVVLETNAPAFLDDLELPHYRHGSLVTQHGIVSGVGVTIPGRNSRPFGVIATYSTEQRRFSEDDVTFLQSIGNILAEAIARDRAEKDLLAARNEAQRRERLADIGAITAKVVHDLGNPLAALSMQAQLLMRRARRGEFTPIEPVIVPVEHCLTTLKRLQDLIKEFNDFARDQRLQRKPIKVRLLLENLAELWKPLAETRQIEIAVVFSDDLPTLHADEDKLRRLLDNLVKNAIDAIEDATGNIEIAACAAADDYIRISIADTGSGVPEGIDVFRLFETTKREGTGIGLAVAKQVVQAHGGRIEHRPRTPHGTVFEIELPCSGVPDSAVQPLTP